MKFHDHTICYENFPNDLAMYSTKSQQMTKHGRKFTIKWKTARLIPRKFIHEIDIQRIIHAKNGVNWMQGSM